MRNIIVIMLVFLAFSTGKVFSQAKYNELKVNTINKLSGTSIAVNDPIKIGSFYLLANPDSIWLEKPLGTWIIRLDNIKSDIPIDSVKMLSVYDASQAYLKIADTIKINNQLSSIRADIQYLKQLTDTTSELVARTIYVSQYTGDDVTGNGVSNTTAFRTINKALLSIKSYTKIYSTITIQLDSGTYSFSLKDKMLLLSLANRSNVFYSSNPIEINGKYKLTSHNLTLSQSTPYISRVTNTTLNAGELNDRFLGDLSSGPFYAIESNKIDTIFALNVSASYNKVYQLLTTIQLDNVNNSQDFYFGDLPTIGLRYLYINVSTNNLYLGGVFIRQCIIDNTNTSSSIVINHSRVTMCKLKNKSTSTTNSNIIFARGCQVTGAVFYNTGTRKTTGYGVSCRDLSQLTLCIYSGYLHAFEFLSPINTPRGAQSGAVLFKDNGVCYSNGLNPGSLITASTDQIVVYNSDYMFRSYSANSGINFNTNQLFGKITTFDPASLNKFIVNPSNGTTITGILSYPEIQLKQTSTLNNNSTDSISIADLSYNRSINIDYTITRNGQYRTGSMKVLNTGTSFLFDPGDYIESSDVGVTFQGVYRSGNSNTLKLKWTTTNTGQNATIQCDYRRQNF